uniref:CD99 antigen-like protein 2 n=1 Tax=Callorhinchus milii TaxID=7868 RepID=V9L5J4_CALMI
MRPLHGLLLVCLASALVSVKAAPTLGANDTGDDGDLDLGDALGPDPDIPDAPKDGDKEIPDLGLDFDEPKPTPPRVGNKPKGSDDGFNLEDALFGDDKLTPTKKPRVPARGGGNQDTDLKDSDLMNGDYKPDQTNSKGRKASGGSADTNGNSGGGGGGGQSAGSTAGIVGGIAMALVGAAGGYFTYQKKKLCFKIQGNTAEQGTKQENVQNQKEDPQSYSTLLQSQSAGGN